MTYSIQATAGLQRQLAKKLRKIGIDVDRALVKGEAVALQDAIQAVGKAHSALETAARYASELGRKGRNVEHVQATPGEDKVRRFVWPVDEVNKQGWLTDPEYAAASRFREQHETLHKSQGVANWSGAGGGSNVLRDGITVHQQAAGAELRLCYDALGRSGTLRAAAMNFVLEMPATGNSSVLDWVDFAKTQIPVTDKTVARLMAFGWVHSVCQVLAEVYERIDYETKLSHRFAGQRVNAS